MADEWRALIEAEEPEDLDALVRSGIDAFERGRYHRALNAFNRVLDIDPTAETPRRYLETIQEINSQLKQAVAAFNSKDYDECGNALARVRKLNASDGNAAELAQKLSRVRIGQHSATSPVEGSTSAAGRRAASGGNGHATVAAAILPWWRRSGETVIVGVVVLLTCLLVAGIYAALR